MKKVIVTLKDDKLEIYNQPAFIRNKGEAARMMEEILADGKSPLLRYPRDFALYEIGEWDEDTGKITVFENHRLLFTPLDFLTVDVSESVSDGKKAPQVAS